MPPNPPQLALWDEALIRRYDLSGPRYTSYPTAPQFSEAFGLSQWQEAMVRSNAQGRPLSIYVHIPFCDTVCYYCGCNKIITANHARALPYLAVLHRELALQAQYVQPGRPVQQLHFGGGTPTYLNDQQLTELLEAIDQHFPLLKDDSGEYAIEIHPKTVNPERLAHLRSLGFNRLSLGVQDFNAEVQRAVNRFNSVEEVTGLLQAARQQGYHSISLDLIYGLPLQTQESFAKTLDQVIEMRPDRLSLFNYAHMPHLFKVQKQIDARQLPEPQEKLQMLHNSIEQLLAAGYVYIGMDHFALPNDELTLAQQRGELHRNFQGYTTGANCDLLAFGVSAINSVDNTFAQNHKDVNDYTAALERGELPIVKGFELSRDDRIRREVINALICQFELAFAPLEQKWDIQVADYFAGELASLKPMAEDGLLEMDGEHIKVSNTGRLLIRRICMVFDAYLGGQTQQAAQPAYSRII